MKRNSGQQLRAKRECFDRNKMRDDTGRVYMLCHICGYRIDITKGEPWDADHVLPIILGGSINDPENVKPAHVKCHIDKTKKDVSRNAKAKRVKDKHTGIRGRGWNTKYKKKMNGQVVLRTGVK